MRRTVNEGDMVRVKEGARGNPYFWGQEALVVRYHPATKTAWGSYITVEFASGATRRYRPAEVEVQLGLGRLVGPYEEIDE